MSLTKINGTQTLGGYFRWEIVYEEKHWKIQHHVTNKAGLQPYRLLDPHNHLMASADTEEEIREYLNEMIH